MDSDEGFVCRPTKVQRLDETLAAATASTQECVFGNFGDSDFVESFGPNPNAWHEDGDILASCVDDTIPNTGVCSDSWGCLLYTSDAADDTPC
eukprot:586709-Amphidinium_carterae.1